MRLLSLGALALGLVAAMPASAALESLVMYDDFSRTQDDLDPNLWGPAYGQVEQKRFINDLNQLEVGQRVLGKNSTSVGTVQYTYGVNFYNPATIKEIAATMKVQGAGATQCAANTDTGFSAARIAGSFFNSGGVTAGSQLNDIIVQVRAERLSTSTAAESVTDLVARVDKCTIADCSTTTSLYRGVLQTGLAPNTAVVVYLRWDKAAKTFYFRKGADAYQTYKYTMDDSVAPAVPFKGLQIRNKIENCATAGSTRDGWAAATFDSVMVNASGDRTPTP